MSQPFAPQTTAHAPTHSRRAFILDDNDANRMLLRIATQLGGMTFTEATDGQSALALWTPGAFGFAFLDIELPDVNGLDVARHMRAEDPALALIMCSANDDPATLAEAIRADCDMFVVKPFHLDRLLRLIRTMSQAELRAMSDVLILDNMGQLRREARLGRAD